MTRSLDSTLPPTQTEPRVHKPLAPEVPSTTPSRVHKAGPEQGPERGAWEPA